MDLKKIKQIIRLVESASISSLAVEADGIKIEVKKELNTVPITTMLPASQGISQLVSPSEPSPIPSEPESDPNLITVTSPMVGTVYLQSKPDAPPYVLAGNVVSQNQVICIIEAMKLYNDIVSDYAGTIEKILVENGQPVEYGQPLFLIRP